jgi:HSP20 family protein
MQLMRRSWDPFGEMETFSERFHRMFGAGRNGGGNETMALADWAPSCDVSETDAEYRIKAELPAVKKEDVRVKLDHGVLTIQGTRREEKEEKGTKYHRRELIQGQFLRQFTMPEDADAANIHAAFKDGILDVVIAKAKSKTPRVTDIAVH